MPRKTKEPTPPKEAASRVSYFLGFDGGGSKTECVLADGEGRLLTRAFAGPSNPLRAGYARAWFALSDAADTVLSRQKIRATDIRGIYAGLGGAGRSGVARRVTAFFEGAYPNARVRVASDIEIALEAAFGAGEGIILLAGTGSAAFGRDSSGKTARAGGRGPWFSDDGSAFDIGRKAFRAVASAEENRGPATRLTERIFPWHQVTGWDLLLEHIAKNPDDVFPRTFPLVAQLADKDDAVSREILSIAAKDLAQLVSVVAARLAWGGVDIPMAKVGGVHGRSKFLDAAIDAEVGKVVPKVRWVPVECSPAEAAARSAVRVANAKGNAA